MPVFRSSILYNENASQIQQSFNNKGNLQKGFAFNEKKVIPDSPIIFQNINKIQPVNFRQSIEIQNNHVIDKN